MPAHQAQIARVLLLSMIVGVLALGCGSSSGSGAPTSAASLVAPGATPAPTPTPSLSPTPTIAPTPTPSPEPSDTVIGEVGRLVVPDQSYAITRPKGWKRIRLDPQSLSDVATLFPVDSDFGRILSSDLFQVAALGMKVMAFDASTHVGLGAYPANLSVLAQPDMVFNLKQLKSVEAAQLGAITGISKVVASDRKLPAGDAVRFTYQVTAPTAAGGELAFRGVQYILVGDRLTYIVSFSCAKLDSLCVDRAEKVMRTLELLP
jgi:hypothetical protein